MACAIVNIINPALEYTLLADFQPPLENFTYYAGLDQEGCDLYKTKDANTIAMEKEAMKETTILGFNTLGYFKHTIENLTSNIYINKENGQGIYVKNTLTITDENFFSMFYKKLENFHVYMNGCYLFGYIYLKYKQQILHYIEQHKNEHFIQTDRNERFLMRDIVNDMILPLEQHYDIAIHIRLGDFNGRLDFIEVDYYLVLFTSLLPQMQDKRICIVYQGSTDTNDEKYIERCLQWFQQNDLPITIESNSLLMDFNIMKQAKILVCSMSTLAWTAAYLSKHIQQCYMPNYNFFGHGGQRDVMFFHKPIENTVLYNVKTSPILMIKPQIITLPEFSGRLAKLDGLTHSLATIGLDTNVFYGVYGKDIKIYNAVSNDTGIKHITWQDTSYFYDIRVRLNGQHMTKGEFGCAWSHLNILRQLVTEPVGTYYLILEDDVELVKPLNELYDLLQHVPADADMCHLAKSNWYPFVMTEKINDYFYECKKQFFNKTTAYLISHKGAQKVLDYINKTINIPIDDLFNMMYRLTPDFRFYVPATYFFKEQDNVESTIRVIDS
jgi:GR25 family glycosyltransferase involved in LPS biosynthesis